MKNFIFLRRGSNRSEVFLKVLIQTNLQEIFNFCVVKLIRQNLNYSPEKQENESLRCQYFQ